MAVRLTADARREQILEVALAEFASDGYHDTSMNDVAEAAGVTKPVLYQHFDSKRSLFLALLEQTGAKLIGAISDATRRATDGKQMTELGFQAYFRWVADDQAGFMLLFGSGARQDEEFAAAVREVHRLAASAVAPLIDVDIDAHHRLTLAHGLVGLAEGASRQLVGLGSDFDPDEVARYVSGLAWAGLRAVQPR